jgi:hypothetical protein
MLVLVVPESLSLLPELLQPANENDNATAAAVTANERTRLDPAVRNIESSQKMLVRDRFEKPVRTPAKRSAENLRKVPKNSVGDALECFGAGL